MIILQQTDEAQIVNFIPRGEVYNNVQIFDEQVNGYYVTEIIESTVGEYYHTIQAQFNQLVENNFYMLIIRNDQEIVFKDKIFCTNQPLVTFSVNNGQYVSTSSNNEFIIYE